MYQKKKNEDRRETSLTQPRIFALKALCKLPLTKLEHLACGVCVPMVSRKECVTMASAQAEGEEGKAAKYSVAVVPSALE